MQFYGMNVSWTLPQGVHDTDLSSTRVMSSEPATLVTNATATLTRSFSSLMELS